MNNTNTNTDTNSKSNGHTPLDENIISVKDLSRKKTKTIFVTGTDTDAGKTYVSEIILEKIKQAGLSCVGFKPVSAGCELTPQGLRNDDALRLMRKATIDVAYDLVNPIAFADPVAPHLAALRQGTLINVDVLDSALHALQALNATLLLVEGAGGWQLPLGKTESRVKGQTLISDNVSFMPDFVIKHQLPVVLVVGMKLGCLNHALLSYQAILASGAKCIGWIANQIDPHMDYYEENLNTLTELIDSPLLADVKNGQSFSDVEFDLDKLFDVVITK